MSNNNNIAYLNKVLTTYQARNISNFHSQIAELKASLKGWANTCYVATLDSGSRAKGTAISLASDVDYLVSLTSNCNDNSGGLQAIYNSLFETLQSKYSPVRKQNVSFRINLNGLEVDVTPGRKHDGNTNDHSLYVSKQASWKKTNIQVHINDISGSGRLKEIRLLKIWREKNGLDFSSIYLEYLTIHKLLYNKSKDENNLESNLLTCFNELAKSDLNPLDSRLVDPANSNNVLSDLLNATEKKKIKDAAQKAVDAKYWNEVYGVTP